MTSTLILYYTALAVILAWSLAMRWRASASYRRRREVDREIHFHPAGAGNGDERSMVNPLDLT